jgi:hypothetical protein
MIINQRHIINYVAVFEMSILRGSNPLRGTKKAHKLRIQLVGFCV